IKIITNTTRCFYNWCYWWLNKRHPFSPPLSMKNSKFFDILQKKHKKTTQIVSILGSPDEDIKQCI
ncbi:TPA: hypothetical protein HNN80_22020, partial [Escherichia coli]|nr:hypothetical protein [Escherichia coli]HAJ7135710.1 hypothetical protein [Escherichia coli]